MLNLKIDTVYEKYFPKMITKENMHVFPRAVIRFVFIVLNNIYCIPTYVVWMTMLWPLKKVNPEAYYRIEGLFFHWLLAMVASWSWSAGYDIVEAGDDISVCETQRTLVIANHQSTADVPLLMACFNAKRNVLPHLMWIMDRLFKYTNFGIVSVLHEDFFIVSGKSNRDDSIASLRRHLKESFIPRKRKWMVLFPEGGFLRKRRETSQRYARKNNLPALNYVTIPRVGALKAIMDEVGPQSLPNNNSNAEQDVRIGEGIRWILDITIGYPGGEPLDLPNILHGIRKPCQTVLLYRLYPTNKVPTNPDLLTQWLYDRFTEKEKLLETFYRTGAFPENISVSTPYQPPQIISQDALRFIILHLFFITSTYFHYQMFYAAYDYYYYYMY